MKEYDFFNLDIMAFDKAQTIDGLIYVIGPIQMFLRMFKDQAFNTSDMREDNFLAFAVKVHFVDWAFLKVGIEN